MILRLKGNLIGWIKIFRSQRRDETCVLVSQVAYIVVIYENMIDTHKHTEPQKSGCVQIACCTHLMLSQFG